ncbi:prenyltransferase/squalene oxidase repeat-containing protein [Spartinivicinus poritis]|uniref:Prenyltransferase alpha-alpha toroid domain-containing protein n=1 Tax=Spartinivicinus poritis TaxID=2994640 RepID=A0ABT5U5U4_9GAMM|nr:prenyltransferase/squalene oxidase repeat-containing protein [Spartinivicinus sp. A2-2]MDE1461736.1 hypothetical protein [Spartinivicinus sp. A2-2]
MKRFNLLICLVGVLAVSTQANEESTSLEIATVNGVAYLLQQQHPDGSWGSSAKNKLKHTAVVAESLSYLNVAGVPLQRAASWLGNTQPQDVEDAARQSLSLTKLGISHSTSLSYLISTYYQDTGSATGRASVWGPIKGYKFSTIDTSLGMLAILQQANTQLYLTASRYLLSRRNQAGLSSENGAGWGFATLSDKEKTTSKVMPTAFALIALTASDRFNTSADVVEAAQWLVSKQKANGLFGDDAIGNDADTVFTALALAKLTQVDGLESDVIEPAYQQAKQYLLDQLDTQGHIAKSALLTATALQAINSTQPSLKDTDDDGVPDLIETKLGHDPNKADAHKLVKGNGLNGEVATLPLQNIGVVKGLEINYPLNSGHGAVKVTSGSLPAGLSFSGDKLTGKTDQTGQFLIAFSVSDHGKVIKTGSASVYVITPDSDLDQDGLIASVEHLYGLNPFNKHDAQEDSDDDGVSNIDEFLAGTNPKGEGSLDTDNDLLPDYDEQLFYTDPNNPDTDGDNAGDGEEVADGRNPLVNEPAVLLINSSLILPIL